MKELGFIAIFYWLVLLLVTATVLIKKLIEYLLQNDFMEWHVVLLWAFLTPITLIIIMLVKKVKEKA